MASGLNRLAIADDLLPVGETVQGNPEPLPRGERGASECKGETGPTRTHAQGFSPSMGRMGRISGGAFTLALEGAEPRHLGERP